MITINDLTTYNAGLTHVMVTRTLSGHESGHGVRIAQNPTFQDSIRTRDNRSRSTLRRRDSAGLCHISLYDIIFAPHLYDLIDLMRIVSYKKWGSHGEESTKRYRFSLIPISV